MSCKNFIAKHKALHRVRGRERAAAKWPSVAQIVGEKKSGAPPSHAASSHARLQPNEDDLMMRLHFPGEPQNLRPPTQCFQQAVKIRKTGQKTGLGLGAYKCCESFQISWFLIFWFLKVGSVSFAQYLPFFSAAYSSLLHRRPKRCRQARPWRSTL